MKKFFVLLTLLLALSANSKPQVLTKSLTSSEHLKMHIKTESLLTAKEIPNGYSWTLTSRLGEMLREIETLYGPRNKDYTVLGIEFEENGPQIWYPGNCKNIIIQLSLNAQYDLPVALYQLAHEAVHLLSPTGGGHALVLEEGLATLFAWNYVKRVTGVDFRTRASKKYSLAALAVEKLLLTNPDFILKARNVNSEFSQFDLKFMQKIAPNIDIGEAHFLALNFNQLDRYLTENKPQTKLMANSEAR